MVERNSGWKMTYKGTKQAFGEQDTYLFYGSFWHLPYTLSEKCWVLSRFCYVTYSQCVLSCGCNCSMISLIHLQTKEGNGKVGGWVITNHKARWDLLSQSATVIGNSERHLFPSSTAHKQSTKWPAPSWPDNSIGRAMHLHRRSKGSSPRSGLNFQAFLVTA